VSEEAKEMIIYLQNQVFAFERKIRDQAKEIEQYRVALSKIEEIVDEI
jgi:hypothetical protein